MIIKAHQPVSSRGEDALVRMIDVPDYELQNGTVEEKLDKIYYYGQNEIQEGPRPSLTVGDIIEMSDSLWRILPIGFVELEDDEKITDHIGLAAHDRANQIWMIEQKRIMRIE